jgi:hypothetical protein
MALATPDSAARISDAEIIAAGLQAGRNNDPEAVVRTLRTVGDPGRRRQLADEIITQLSSRDPRAATNLALSVATELGNIASAESAARKLAQREPDDALQWTLRLPANAAGRQVTRAIIDELVRVNASEAIDRIRALPTGPARDDLLVLGASAWARRDPDSAISWLGGQPDDGLKPRLASSVGFEVAQTRPDRALTVAEMLPEGRNRWLLFSAIAQTWVAVDSQAALSWAGKLPAGEPRDAAFAGIETGFGVPISRRTGGAPGTRGGSSRTRGGAVAAALWPELNSPTFEAWLAAQPRGMSREEAILEYIRQRAALEPSAIGPLVERLPPGYTKDQAKEIYLDGLLIGGSPLEAARWVRSLPRSERSDELIEKTARRWLMLNPDAAAEWVEQSTLPAHRKEQLLRDAGR